MPILIKNLNGPFADEVRRIKSGEYDPMDFFASMINHGWRWQISYKSATEEEKTAWLKAEVVARILRALQERRPVYCLGITYQSKNDDDILVVGQEIEDAIVYSNTTISVGSDDEQGLVINNHEQGGY